MLRLTDQPWLCGTCQQPTHEVWCCPACHNALCPECETEPHSIPAGNRVGKPCTGGVIHVVAGESSELLERLADTG